MQRKKLMDKTYHHFIEGIQRAINLFSFISKRDQGCAKSSVNRGRFRKLWTKRIVTQILRVVRLSIALDLWKNKAHAISLV
ncbi:hypothetical protein MKW98_025659 [Papaver atlanticum]|uniref:Uncharacterized protein n=1 Tax=Papaver atlanticum TaxID=357466 RepID=A0AAD4SD89_9MAGN|nr:hypothetical protein MKW98_025659 [Papaver atlanticum]